MNDSNALSNTPNELDRLLTAASEALTDQMVERLTETVGNGLEILDRLNDPHTKEAVHNLLDELTELNRTGGMTAIFEILHFINAMRNALTDSMVERLALFAEHMVNNLANEEVASMAHVTKEAVNNALQETNRAPPASGLLAAMKMLGEPETLASLQFMRSVTRNLRQLSD